jgi:hypothetical protein
MCHYSGQDKEITENKTVGLDPEPDLNSDQQTLVVDPDPAK